MWGFLAVGVVAVLVAGLSAFALNRGTHAEASAPLPTDRSSPAATAVAAPRVAFLGDSWTSNGKDVGIPAYTAAAFGWEAFPFGQGGTGYLNPGPAENGVLPFSARVADVVAVKPDVVFILGGLNDRGRDYATPEAMRAATVKLYDDLTVQIPDVRLVIVGPYYPGANVPGDLLEIRDIQKEEAAARSLPFIDPIAGEWLTGDPAVAGSGNAADMIENSHPNPAGQRHLADMLIAAIKATPGIVD